MATRSGSRSRSDANPSLTTEHVVAAGLDYIDEHGLEVALGELAGRQALGGFVVDVRCDPCDGLDPRVAAAAYAIASERPSPMTYEGRTVP